jgi:hypothetical protein
MTNSLVATKGLFTDLPNSGSLSRASVYGCAHLSSPAQARRLVAVASLRRDELGGPPVVIVADLGVHARAV